MPSPHVIRLNRAWELFDAPEIGSLDQALGMKAGGPLGRLDLPLDRDALGALPVEHSARVVLIRRFNGPTNLQPGQRVCLSLQTGAMAIEIALNGVELLDESGKGLHDADRVSYEVGGRLERYNRLTLLTTPAQLPKADVRLMIYESDLDERPTGADDQQST